MYKYVYLGIVACVMAAALSACDKMPFNKKKQTPLNVSQTPASTSAAPVQTSAALIPVQGTIIATVNNQAISLEGLNEEIDQYNASVPEDKAEMRITTRDKKINYLKSEVVRRWLLYQEGIKRGLDKNKDVVKALDDTKQQLVMLQLMKDEMDKVDVSGAAIESYYNAYKDQLEERRIREIMVPTEAEAKDALIKLLQGQDFASLASQISKAPSAAKGGDMGFIKKGEHFKEFDDAAFSDALAIGQTSSIFKGEDGFYLIKLESKKQKTLKDVWEDIKNGLTFVEQQKRVEDLINELNTKAAIVIKEELVN